MGPTSDFAERIARVSARVIDRLYAGVIRVAIGLKVLPVIKVFAVLVAAGFGCLLLSGAADPYPHLNSYGWTISTNNVLRSSTALRSYKDLITPKFALDDAPPPPDLVERALHEQAARERQERYRKRIPIPNAVSDKVREAYVASQNALAVKAVPASSGHLLQFFLYAVLFFFIGLLAVMRLAPELLVNIQKELNPWLPDPARAAGFSAKVRSEEDAFAQFLTNFRVGPTPRVPASLSGNSSNRNKVERNVIREFTDRTAGLILKQRRIFEDIDRAWNDYARHKMMTNLCHEMNTLKEEANFPEVLLVWQVASAMEGLLKQLTDRKENVTPSTLRTIRGGVDLLTDLCKPGFKPDLLNERPLRFLAVDDDLISRKALSAALKKALNPPDLAMDGKGALIEVGKHAYDVIFLDVQMPDMDGFELCTKIHETEINRTTPVVFVTGQSDFNARAQSTLSGGTDLMAKPFLTFEVTVKALTLGLRGRMQEHWSTSALVVADPAVIRTSSLQSVQEVEISPVSCGLPVMADVENTMPIQVLSSSPRDKRVVEFLALLTKHLPALKKNCQKIVETPEAEGRQDIIADAFLRVHAFIPDVTLALRHPAFQMSVVLEGLLRKLLADQKNYSDSVTATVVAVVDLLHDLNASDLAADLATNPPVEILVVDDDTISRRAIVGALQLVFEKPQAVESGEAALAVTAERAFDVIFMDVVMPGMDGFAACQKIRESQLNFATPVVFVTGKSDYAARVEMTESGGSDLMGKPFLAAEITAKALAFALRGRLQKQKQPILEALAE